MGFKNIHDVLRYILKLKLVEKTQKVKSEKVFQVNLIEI